MGKRIAHEVDPAPLPGGGKHLRHCGLDALMRIGDGELDAAQASSCQLAQEFRPDRFCLGCPDFHAEHFASAVGVDAHRDDDGDSDDAPAAMNLQIGGMSRRCAPYRTTAAGFASPLAEPDVRLSLRIRLCRRHGKVRHVHPRETVSLDRCPAEHVLLNGPFAPNPSRRPAPAWLF